MDRNKFILNIAVNGSIFHCLPFISVVLINSLMMTLTITIVNILLMVLIISTNEKPINAHHKCTFNYENIVYFGIMIYLNQNVLFVLTNGLVVIQSIIYFQELIKHNKINIWSYKK